MLSRDLKSKSINNLSRGKSLRRFGQDLTNYYNFQANKDNKLSSINFQNIASLQPQCRRSFNGQYGLRYPQSTVCYQINLMIGQTTYDPINDHLNDIMSYTLSQSYNSSFEEDYMRWHSQINQQMRETLINWLIKIHTQLKLQHSTLCLAIYLIDKFCYQQSITKSRYQLLGVACLFLAAKYEQLVTPRISRFLEVCEGLCTRKNIVQMEGQVLESVGFNINRIVLLRELLFNRVDQSFRAFKLNTSPGQMQQENEPHANQQMNVLIRCQYLIQIALIEYKFTLLQPHYLSAVLLYISCKKENVTAINSKYIIEKYNLSQKSFKQHFQAFLALLKRKGQLKFKEINKKYHFLNNQY